MVIDTAPGIDGWTAENSWTVCIREQGSGHGFARRVSHVLRGRSSLHGQFAAGVRGTDVLVIHAPSDLTSDQLRMVADTALPDLPSDATAVTLAWTKLQKLAADVANRKLSETTEAVERARKASALRGGPRRRRVANRRRRRGPDGRFQRS